MFDFLKFRDVANCLSNGDNEEYARSAISRYYYSVFGCARLYLIFVMGENDFRKYGNIHSKLCGRLKESDDEAESALGDALEELRQLGNLADYNWDDDNPYFFKKRVNFVKKESELALIQIEALKRSPPFNV